MNKKGILFKLLLAFLFIIIIYNKPINLKSLILPYSIDNLPEKISADIHFSAHSSKELDVVGEEAKKEIISLLSSVKVKTKLFALKAYTPKLKETYTIIFYGANEKEKVYIYIYNREYIKINYNTYKIMGNLDLSQIYDSIISDQPEGSLDEFYHNINK